MFCVTGDEGGVVKHVSFGAAARATAAKDAKSVCQTALFDGCTQSRANGVAALAWCGSGDGEGDRGPHSEFVAALRSGVVVRWNTTTRKQVHRTAGAPGNVVFLSALDRADDTRVCSVGGEGPVHVWLKSAASCGPAAFAVRGPVSAAALSGNCAMLACGGRENDLAVWDIEKQATVFSAKNVKHDKLNLRVPVWITGVQFLSSGAASDGGLRLLTTCTGTGRVRVYDTRASSRPIRDYELNEYPFTALAPCPSSAGAGAAFGSIVLGDTVGTLVRVDLDSGRTLGGFKGAGGCIRGLAMHHPRSAFASVGLDRWLRVHSLKGAREVVHAAYLKQRLTAVLISERPRRRTAKADGEGSDSEDSVFDELEEVDDAGVGGDAVADDGDDDGGDDDGESLTSEDGGDGDDSALEDGSGGDDSGDDSGSDAIADADDSGSASELSIHSDDTSSGESGDSLSRSSADSLPSDSEDDGGGGGGGGGGGRRRVPPRRKKSKAAAGKPAKGTPKKKQRR